MKVFICIDDEDCIENLSELLYQKKIDENMMIDSYTQYPQILRSPLKGSYNVAFISDYIDGNSGFKLGRELHCVNPECLIIYIGNDYSHMHESFRAFGFGMFLKKELYDLFNGEFQRIWTHYQQLHHQVLFYLDQGGSRRFLPSEIVYIECGRFQTKVVTESQYFYGHFHDLSRVKKKLMNYSFFQMHPYYFVNMHHILLIRNGELEMCNGDCVPTSIMNKEVINDAIQSFVSSL